MPQNNHYLFPGLSYVYDSTTKNPSYFSKMNPDGSSLVSAMNSSPTDAAAIGKSPHKPKSLSEIVMMGAIASGIYTALAPIERVYTLMQCQNELLKTGRLSRPYKGITDCFRKTIKYQGFCSLWRGNSIYLFNVCFNQGLMLAVSKLPQNDHSHDPPFGASLAVSVIFANSLLYPFSYAQVRLYNDVTDTASTKTRITYATNRLFSGPFDVVRKTLASDGIHGIYRGYTITCFGYFIYYSAVFAAKDVVSKYSLDKRTQINLTISPGIASGILTLICIPALVYPVGTVSKRMMLRSGEANKYKDSIDALTQIVRKEGVGALYKGLTPHLISHLAKASIISTVLYSSAKLGILMSRDDLKI